MAIDMDAFVKKPANPFAAKSRSVTDVTSLKDLVNTSKQKSGIRYFYSKKPNLGFFMNSTRIAFRGNYYETADSVVAAFIVEHYGKYVSEITVEQKIDGTSLKQE